MFSFDILTLDYLVSAMENILRPNFEKLFFQSHQKLNKMMERVENKNCEIIFLYYSIKLSPTLHMFVPKQKE
jgi:hypothetical protein